jgi:6-phosphogluconate dehydrogenase
MQLGIIGLGRMGGNIARRLMRAEHRVVVQDRDDRAVAALAKDGASAATSVKAMVSALETPRAIWIMVPAAVVDRVIDDLVPHLEAGDIIIDGGNSRYHDDLRRAHALGARGIKYVDVGTSGGVWGLERGYCLMIGGDLDVVTHLDPIFRALAPGKAAAPETAGVPLSASTAEEGYLHCGPPGAGHFVKMVHNAIEYGLMAAYAEGFNLMHRANAGQTSGATDGETTPLDEPAHFQYDLDIAAIAEVWRRGSVIGSWLLDLTAHALREHPTLDGFAGRVADSGEGRWTAHAAVDLGVPMPMLAAALFQRFASRGEGDFANKVLSAMRLGFGGHTEKA